MVSFNITMGSYTKIVVFTTASNSTTQGFCGLSPFQRAGCSPSTAFVSWWRPHVYSTVSTSPPAGATSSQSSQYRTWHENTCNTLLGSGGKPVMMRSLRQRHSRPIASVGELYSWAGSAKTRPLTDEEHHEKPLQRKSLCISPRSWATFKEEQKEVVPSLVKRHGEKDTGWLTGGAEGTSDAGASRNSRTNTVKLMERQRERVTLGRFMIDRCLRNPESEATLPIMRAVGKACTAVSRLVRRAQIDGMAGLHVLSKGSDGLSESMNVQGEVQKELDVLSNSIFLTGLCQPRVMSCVASEEEEVPRKCSAVVGQEAHGGEYAAVFDPLDGSANIEAGLPCGTIFGILRTSGSAREGMHTAGPSTIVLPGRRLVAAGYCLYGSSTKLVFTLGDGVFEFTLDERGLKLDEGMSGNASDDDKGIGGGELDFILSRSNVQIPKRGRLYSVNEANFPTWSEAIQDYFLDLKKPPAETSIESSTDSPLWPPPAPTQGMENQYTGALVADVHNVLTHGGVFAYPADLKNPNGKLRLLYEGNPMAMIVEQAGGVATTGFERIRDIRPQSVHHRIPAFFGSPDDVLPLLDPKYLHSRSR